VTVSEGLTNIIGIPEEEKMNRRNI